MGADRRVEVDPDGEVGQRITSAIVTASAQDEHRGNEHGGNAVKVGDGVADGWTRRGARAFGRCSKCPCVAQRTGATIYYIELFAQSHVRAHGGAPVLAQMPVPGEVDIVIASELREAGRAMQRGLVTPKRTTLITSSDVPDALIYKITKAIVEGRDEFGNVTSVMKGVTGADMATNFGMPLHPGAEKYYREAGLLKK